ncbi:hypothetical protein AB0H81_27785, partial [Nonomuraea sp. NPDC050691]
MVAPSADRAWCRRIRPRGPTDAAAAATREAAEAHSAPAGSVLLEDQLDQVRGFLDLAAERGVELVLPVDVLA